MPQIGWFEIIVVVVLAILIIGPKDVPIMLRKIGSWVGSLKGYFNEVQNEVADIKNSVDDDVSLSKDFSENNNKKDE